MRRQGIRNAVLQTSALGGLLLFALSFVARIPDTWGQGQSVYDEGTAASLSNKVTQASLAAQSARTRWKDAEYAYRQAPDASSEKTVELLRAELDSRCDKMMKALAEYQAYKDFPVLSGRDALVRMGLIAREGHGFTLRTEPGSFLLWSEPGTFVAVLAQCFPGSFVDFFFFPTGAPMRPFAMCGDRWPLQVPVPPAQMEKYAAHADLRLLAKELTLFLHSNVTNLVVEPEQTETGMAYYYLEQRENPSIGSDHAAFTLWVRDGGKVLSSGCLRLPILEALDQPAASGALIKGAASTDIVDRLPR